MPPLARRVRLLAGPAARGRLVRRLPALPRGLPGRQRLSRASRRRAEGDPGEDAGEGRARQELQGERARRARRSPACPSTTAAGSAPKATRAWWRASCRNSRKQQRAQRRRPRSPRKTADGRDLPGSRSPPTAIKAKARALGADLVGIADGAALERHPPDPKNPQRPSDITEHDGGRVIVLAKRLSRGVARIAAWNDRHKYYNDELALTRLEEASLELVYWLEDNGYPAIIVPPTHVDPWTLPGRQAAQASLDPAVAAACGGRGRARHARPEPAAADARNTARAWCSPRCSARSMSNATRAWSRRSASGPSCARCLKVCPGDAVGHWSRDWEACDPHRSPHGFPQLSDHVARIIAAPTPEAQKELVRSEDSFNLWQSILRGAGVITGCRKCADVCPVGADYQAMLSDALDAIPELDARQGSSAPPRWSRTNAPAGCPKPMRRSSAGSAKRGSRRDACSRLPKSRAEIARDPAEPQAARGRAGASARRSTPASSTTSISTGSTIRTSGARSRSSPRTCCARCRTATSTTKFCVKPDDGIAEFWRSGGATGAPLFYPRSFEDIRYAMVGFSRIYQCAGCRAGRARACVVPARHPSGRPDAGALRDATSASR